MAEADGVPSPPPGFVESPGRGPFGRHNGPYFEPADGGPRLAFFVLERHTNKLGVAHGGMMSAFLDTLMGTTINRRSDGTAVTVHLSTDFLRMARRGDWVIAEAAILRTTRDVVFAEAVARVEGVEVVRASGVFKLMRRR